MNSRVCQRLGMGGAIILVVGLAFARGVRAQSPGELPEAVQSLRDSVVLVDASLSFGPQAPGPVVTSNTGFFVSRQGHVLTSALTLGGAEHIEVQDVRGQRSEAHLWALDQRAGLAVLASRLRDTKPIELRQRPMDPMQWIAGIQVTRGSDGAPIARFAQGVVSLSDASLRICGYTWRGLLATDLNAEAGSAAGPVVDQEGKLVGVVLGVQTTVGGRRWCYVLPRESLSPVLIPLLEGKTRRQGWLGLAVARSGEQEGLVVCGVLENGPGHTAGLRTGDVLLEIESKPIRAPNVFEETVVRLKPEQTVAMTYLRGTELRRTSVCVGVRPLMISRVVQPVPPVALYPQTFLPEAEAAARESRIERLEMENRRLLEMVRNLDQEVTRLKGETQRPERK